MFVMYQDCLSPHQLPLARALASQVGPEHFHYVYRDLEQMARRNLGWDMNADATWQMHIGSHPIEARNLIENAEVLVTMFREPDLLMRRMRKKLLTFYASERWFKPFDVGLTFGFSSCLVSGRLRLLHPRYTKMLMQMVHWLKTDPNGFYLHVGPWAKKDMETLGVPESKMIPWGYFVNPSNVHQTRSRSTNDELKVLYVGRLLKLKRVDTILKAVARLCAQQVRVKLSILGSGSIEEELRRLARRLQLDNGIVEFLPPVPIEKVRMVMQVHDVLVFSSNALDGWGAVVSEALEEGLPVVGTRETGASPTLLPPENLYSCGDDKALAQCLLQFKSCPMPQDYTAAGAAMRLIQFVGAHSREGK